MHVFFYVMILLVLKIQLCRASVCNESSIVKSKSYDIKYMNGKNLDYNRDQDSTGYCYAYAQADALEQFLRKNGVMDKGTRISALALAISHDKERWDNEINKVAKSSLDFVNTQARVKQLNRSLTNYDQQLIKIDNRLLNIEEKMFPTQMKIRKEIKAKIDSASSYKEAKKLEDYLKKIIKQQRKESSKKHHLIRAWLRSKEKLKQLISKTEEEERQLLPYKFFIPSGGTIEKIKYGQTLCYENELSSSDNGIKVYYRKNFEEFKKKKLFFYPHNLSDSLGYIATKKNINNENCILYDVVKEIMPDLPLSFSDFDNIVKKMKKSDNIFEKIMLSSCAKKGNLPKKIPEMKTTIKEEKLDGAIDEALKNGKIAMIAYSSGIFSARGFGGQHASTIVGKVSLCNQPYYVLKNSWGNEACKKNRDQFLGLNSEYSKKYNAFYKEFSDCYNQNKKEWSSKTNMFCQKQSAEYKTCLNKYGEELEQKQSVCSSTFDKKKQSAASTIKTPFYCDDRGNYIVEKKHLLKGLSRVTYFKN